MHEDFVLIHSPERAAYLIIRVEEMLGPWNDTGDITGAILATANVTPRMITEARKRYRRTLAQKIASVANIHNMLPSP